MPFPETFTNVNEHGNGSQWEISTHETAEGVYVSIEVYTIMLHEKSPEVSLTCCMPIDAFHKLCWSMFNIVTAPKQ